MKKNDHENNENLPFMKTELNGNIDFKYTHTQEYRYEFNFDKYTRLKQTHRKKKIVRIYRKSIFITIVIVIGERSKPDDNVTINGLQRKLSTSWLSQAYNSLWQMY